jgi:CRP/FNR family transcriptional regulator, cyclic AMP receptor protein
MPVEGHDNQPGRIRWPPSPDTGPSRTESAALYTYLLDVDDDLAQEFDIRMRVAARQVATVRVIAAEVGPCDLGPWFEAVGGGPGLLILDGLIAFETRVGDRTACELTGAGDLLQPPSPRAEQLVEQRDGWRALWPTRFGMLDHEFSERVRPWPQIGLALLRRAGRRIADADALRAIACQPRLEVRLTLLMWHLATRWGRVEPSGIRLTLPLTHRLLGQLVAAERPSVSHALARLAHSGLVTGSAGDLHLHGTLDHHLEALIERPNSLAGRQRGARSAKARQIA